MTGNRVSWNEPILAIDFGTTYSSAFLVPPGGRESAGREPSSREPGNREPVGVREPGHDYFWPSAVLAARDGLTVGSAAADRKRDAPQGAYCSQFKRDLGTAAPIRLNGQAYAPEDLMKAVVQAIVRAARDQLALIAPGAKPGRTVLTVPVSYQGNRRMRALMFSVMESVVPGPVELLPEPVAAAWGLRPALASGDRGLVLVYDFGGGTFDAALIEMGPGSDWNPLGMDSVRGGGKDIDADLAGLLRTETAGWLDSWLEGVPEEEARSRRYRFEAESTAVAEELKHQLTEGGERTARILTAPQVQVTRDRLAATARPYISETIRCCRSLLAAQDKTVADLDEVLLVGGTTKMPLVGRMLREELLAELPEDRRTRLVNSPPNRDLAVAYGAARWAIDNEICCVPPLPGGAGGSVLRWDLSKPGRSGQPGQPSLMHWHAGPGRQYQPGDALARVRYADGALWDLVAHEPGVLGPVLTEPVEADGEPVTSRQWIATTERW